MEYIGIIGAMPEEVEQLIGQMTDSEKKTMAGMDFYNGSLWGKKAVVVKSGIGKVNMAACTQILASIYGVDALINTGVAGGLYGPINIGDIVISSDTLQHDMDATDISFSPEHLAKIIQLTEAGTINNSVAKEVFEKVFAEDIDPEKYIEEHGLKSDNDEDALRATIEQIVKDNPQSVEDYHNGKEKAIGFLVGQTMKATKGKANPGMVNKILKELL